MITLKKYLKAINYKVSEGSPFCWECYGPNAHYLDSIILKKYHASAIFDRETQIVYEVELHDYVKNKSYRWMHPQYIAAHNHEAKKKGVNADVAYTDLDHDHLFNDLTEEDMLKKLKKIIGKV